MESFKKHQKLALSEKAKKDAEKVKQQEIKVKLQLHVGFHAFRWLAYIT